MPTSDARSAGRRPSCTGRGRRRGSCGFTLLEVLAAFLIFSVLFTVLAGTASEAFRMEGENRRRLEASLLADQQFAQIELQARGGLAPPVGEQTSEQDIFTLTTTVKPLTPEMLGLDLELLRGDDPDPRGRNQDEAPGSILFPSREEDALMRQVDLVVAWEEGDRLVEVRRTTIAVDTSELAFASTDTGDPGRDGELDPGSDLGDGLGGGQGESDFEGSTDDMIQQMLQQLGELSQ